MISLLPEHYLLGAVLVLICYGISFGLSGPMNFPFIYKNMSYLSILVLLNVLFLTLNDFIFSTISFNFFFLKDDLVVLVELFTLLVTFNILLAVVKYNKEMHIYYFEYVLLILFMVLSIYFLISSNELISFYFILEFQGICLYVLAAFNRKQKSSLEAGIKYFILGSFSSIILFLGFIIHIGLAARLTSQNRNARPVAYVFQASEGKTSIFSKYMGVTGSIILIFLLVHLYSFFVKHRIIGTEETMYETVKTAFSNPIYVLFYVVAQVLLAFHLNHGFQSGFQSLGLKTNLKWNSAINQIGLWFSILIPLGFAIIPIIMFIQSI